MRELHLSVSQILPWIRKTLMKIASEIITTSAPATTGEWSDWSSCPATCGGSGYYQVRTRSGDGEKDFKLCNSNTCPGS